mmetsp:Transcript_2249/g.5307  ORF Transcript_2249/g.5307 Transcript_2249/m.5307 type:complete len:222 (+) Transcript_2249:67-732(+)
MLGLTLALHAPPPPAVRPILHRTLRSDHLAWARHFLRHLLAMSGASDKRRSNACQLSGLGFHLRMGSPVRGSILGPVGTVVVVGAVVAEAVAVAPPSPTASAESPRVICSVDSTSATAKATKSPSAGRGRGCRAERAERGCVPEATLSFSRAKCASLRFQNLAAHEDWKTLSPPCSAARCCLWCTDSRVSSSERSSESSTVCPASTLGSTACSRAESTSLP